MATDTQRMEKAHELNSEATDRTELEKLYGQVWDTTQLQKDFVVEGFAAPVVVVMRKKDGVRGSLLFQNRPRFYFNFEEAKGK